MTIAEQLEAKGIEKGIFLGRQEGEHSASLKIARQLLTDGVRKSAIKRYTGLFDDELADGC